MREAILSRLARKGQSAFLVLALGLLAGTAWAHGDENAKGKVVPELDTPPPDLDGVRIELRETLTQQLLVENTTDRPLFILDENGRAFLQIGPGKTQADLGVAAFHRSNTLTGAGSVPAGANHDPDWHQVADEPAWGWLDLRLRGSGIEVPHGVEDGGKREKIGEWRIPVRLGDTQSAISGQFNWVPTPQGVYEAKITGGRSFAPGVVLTTLNGGNWPGLFISNTGDSEFTVLGEDKKPFLRYTPDRVLVNRRSPTWAKVARSGGPRPVVGDDTGKPEWAVVSQSGSYGWIEPRAASKAKPPEAQDPTVVKNWTVPVNLANGASTQIEGATEWVPIEPAATAGR